MFLSFFDKVDVVLLILIGVLLLGFAESVSSQRLKTIKKLSSTGLLMVGYIVTILLNFVFIFTFKIPFQHLALVTILIIIAIELVAYLASRLFYKGYKFESASVVSVLAMTSIVASTIFGYVMFGELIPLVRWIGILLIVISIYIANSEGDPIGFAKKIGKIDKYKILAMIGGLLYGLSFALTKLIVQDVNPHFFHFVSALLGFPLVILLDYKEMQKQFSILRKPTIFFSLAWIIVLYYAYNKIRFVAYSRGFEIPIADALDNSVVFVIIFFEYFIFKIKQEKLIFKLLIGLIAFAGILLIL